MSDSLGDLVVNVGADISDLSQNLNKAADEVRGFSDEVADQLGSLGQAGTAAGAPLGELPGRFHEAGEGAHEASEGIGEVAEKLIQLGEALAIVEALKEFASEALEVYAATEKFATGMALLTDSTETAEKTLEEIKAIAANQPFAFPELLPAVQRLTAFGIQGAELTRTIEAAADAAAATGNSFDTVASSLGRVMLTGQVSARQLVQLGLSSSDLAKTMGTTIDDAEKLLARGGQDALADLDVVLAAANAKFAGASAQMGQTLSGQFTILKNQFHFLMDSVGEALAPIAKQFMTFVQESVLPFLQGLIDGFNKLSPAMKDFAVAAAIAVAAIGPLTLAVGGFGLAISGLSAALPILTPVLEVLGAIGVAIGVIKFTGIIGDVQDLGVAIKNNLGPLPDLLGGISTLIGGIASAIEKMTGSLSGGVVHDALVALTGPLGMIDLSIRQITANLEKLGGSYKSMADAATAQIARVNAANDEYSRKAAADALAAADAQDKAYQKQQAAAALAAQAAKAAAEEIQKQLDAFAKSAGALLDRIPETYQAYITQLSEGGASARSLLTSIEREIEKASELMKGMSGAPLASMQAWVEKLRDAQQQVEGFARSDAFAQLAIKVADLTRKFPAQLASLDTATLEFVHSMEQVAASVPEALDKVSLDKVIENVLASQKQLDDQTQKLGQSFENAYSKMTEHVKDAVPIVANLQERLAGLDVTQQNVALSAHSMVGDYLSMVKAINDLGMQTQAQMEGIVAEHERILALMQQMNQPLQMQLQLAGQILQEHIRIGEAIGASGDGMLKWTEKLAEVQMRHNAIMDQTRGLSDLYLGMLDSFSKAWDGVSQSIADSIATGQDFGKAFMSVLTSLEKSITELVVKYLMTQLKDAILTNTGLLHEFGNVFNSLFSAGGSVPTAFDTTQKTIADTSKQIADTAKTTADQVTNVMNKTTDGVKQVGSAATSALGSIFDMITGGISAITGIIGVFQDSHMNKVLGEIETNTRKIFNVVGLADGVWEHVKRGNELLTDIHTSLDIIGQVVFSQLEDVIRDGLTGLWNNINGVTNELLRSANGYLQQIAGAVTGSAHSLSTGSQTNSLILAGTGAGTQIGSLTVNALTGEPSRLADALVGELKSRGLKV